MLQHQAERFGDIHDAAAAHTNNGRRHTDLIDDPVAQPIHLLGGRFMYITILVAHNILRTYTQFFQQRMVFEVMIDHIHHAPIAFFSPGLKLIGYLSDGSSSKDELFYVVKNLMHVRPVRRKVPWSWWRRVRPSLFHSR